MTFSDFWRIKTVKIAIIEITKCCFNGSEMFTHCFDPKIIFILWDFVLFGEEKGSENYDYTSYKMLFY